jgi:PhnB protein
MQGVIPYVAIKGADEAIAFYRRAFGAVMWEEPARQNGRVMNASIEINGGMLMLMDEMADRGAPAAKGDAGYTLQLVVTDGDAWWTRAIEAGCTVTMPFEPQFWGDRYGRLRDPFGLDWAINEPSAENQAKAKEFAPS